MPRMLGALLIGGALAQLCWAQQPPTRDRLRSHGDNLIENGSFEESPVGPVLRGEVPEGWDYEAYGDSGQLEIIAGGAPGCGERCLKVTTNVADRRSGLHGPMLPIDPTRAYLQWGWLKIEGDKPPGGGLYLGRAWFDAERNPVGSAPGRDSNYNYVIASAGPEDWTYYEQLLLPDPTPDDGSYRADEIPATAAFLRIWALSFEWEGVAYFDGLALYEADFAAKVRDQINSQLEGADMPQVRTEIEQELNSLPAEDEVAARAGELLAALAALTERLQSQERRTVREWTAERDGAADLIGALERVRWELKIEALLLAADLQAAGQ